MRFVRNRLTLGAIAMTLALAACEPPRPPEPPLSRWDSAARLLAGMDLPETDTLYPLTLRTEWKVHHEAMDRRFSLFEEMYGKAMADWSASELAGQKPDVLFYPFGGPDLLFPVRLFPDCKEYISIGMESPGKPPDPGAMEPANLGEIYPTIRKSLAWFLNFTYFQTFQMDKWLRGRELGGAGPVMMVFLARSGAHITAVEEVTDGGARGIRITFERGGKTHTASYYNVNVSDASLTGNSAFLDFVRSRGRRIAFMKAASYLLHYSGFDRIRDFVTHESEMILTDEAGLALSSFDPGMKLTFYGNYQGPLPMYWPSTQKALEAVYAREAKPIPFDFGYTASWKRDSSVVIVGRRL